MSTWLFLLAVAALILSPSNPVGLVLLFILACLRVWRTSESETIDHPGGDCDMQDDCQPILGSGDLT